MRDDSHGITLTLPASRTRRTPAHTLGKTLAQFARRKPLGVVGGLILLGMVALAMLAPVLPPFDPYDVHVLYKYAEPGAVIEETGQRLWLGALIGLISAYCGGTVDLIVQRIVDTVMAFPAIILALAVVAIAGASLRNVILALVVLLLPASARVVRSQALALREMDYVLAARAVGGGSWRFIEFLAVDYMKVLPSTSLRPGWISTSGRTSSAVGPLRSRWSGVGSPRRLNGIPSISRKAGRISTASPSPPSQMSARRRRPGRLWRRQPHRSC